MSSYPGDQRWADEQHAKRVNEAAAERVPGAEPLSPVEAKLAEIHRLADTGSLWLGMAAAPSAALSEGRVRIRTLAREALEALRAERTAAPASGEVQFPAIDLLRDWLIQFLGRSASVPADHIQPREPCYVPDQARLLLMELGRALASSLTPQQDVEATCRTHDDPLICAAWPTMVVHPMTCGNSDCRDATNGAPIRVLADRQACDLCGWTMPLPWAVPPAPAAQALCACGHPKTDHSDLGDCHHRLTHTTVCQCRQFAAQARSAGRVDLERVAREVASIALDCDHGVHVLWCGDCLNKAVAALQRDSV